MKLLNAQAIEKLVTNSGHALDVHSVFATIQGEGPFVGTPAIFVRLAGCNLCCPACDTDYTSTRERKSINPLLAEVEALAGATIKLVVITGGEPFRQNISFFVSELLSSGFTVQIETNGTLPLHLPSHQNVHVVVSPKTGKVDDSIWQRAQTAKYVLSADSIDPLDGLPRLVLGHTAHPRVARPPAKWPGQVYVQPADEENYTANLTAAIASVGRFGYRLSLQLHKIIGLP
jgi:organic radical activating enzyme